jgi:hypothetical protein
VKPALTPTALVLALAATTVAAPGRALAAPNPKRGVAVLEYRAGSAAIPDIGARAAAILRAKTSLRVIDGNDARTTNSGVDTAIARCGGRADCVAALGNQLGVDEVLLVGVSEFGDVILTLQRIDVNSGDVASRVAEALAPDAAPDDDALTRYLERVMPRGDFIRFGTIRITANVTGAMVTIGTRDHGATPIDPVRVRAPATYDIKVHKSGYTPFTVSVDVPPDAVVQVKPMLSRGVDDAWYKRWWVAAIAGTVVAGAVGVTIIATRDDPTNLPVVIREFE